MGNDNNKKLDETTSLFCGVIDEQFLLAKSYTLWTFSVCKSIYLMPSIKKTDPKKNGMTAQFFAFCVPFFECQWGYNQARSVTQQVANF